MEASSASILVTNVNNALNGAILREPTNDGHDDSPWAEGEDIPLLVINPNDEEVEGKGDFGRNDDSNIGSGRSSSCSSSPPSLPQCRICLESSHPWSSLQEQKSGEPHSINDGRRFIEEGGERGLRAESGGEGDLSEGWEPLIAPCSCKGSQKYVHRSCLDHWRATKEGFAFAHCTECKAEFRLRPKIPPDRWLRKQIVKLLVARDYFVIFFTVLLAVAAIGFSINLILGGELQILFGFNGHPAAFAVFSFTFLLFLAAMYSFFIAIICGDNISQRYHHILQKQELTQEYVVEDIECGQNSSKHELLGSEHLYELREMGFL
eukprot:TRINITY_DN3920_c0_g1_i2.p1 TRINITY_DN3920_c0_g1~~TRINITY_DN3920_c0_g1_i2.p1  ORF type:complete len:321 (+),score=47.58 TRINITY_DN3920_c0_g1_i2:126-1088(+)